VPARVRVLWITKGLGRGGAEQLLLNCARHVDTSRFEVEVAYVLPGKDALVSALRGQGLKVHCLSAGEKTDRRWPLRLRRLVRERGYDLVHTHAPVPAVAARLLLPRGLPMVHTEHNLWPRYRLPTRVANKWTYGRVQGVVAVSQAVADSIDPKRTKAVVEVVHHGPDLAAHVVGPGARERARTRLDLDLDVFTVGTVANFTPKKDQATLLEAHALLRRYRPDAKLVMIGSGPLEAQLRSRAAEPDLAGSVVFAGSRSDVPELLPGFDVFTLSSRQEGLPVSLMEAMATGLPVAVTAVGGMPEIVTDGVEGRLVPPGNADALAEVFQDLAGDPAERVSLGKAAAVRAQAFDVAGAQRRVEELYGRVLSR
jgi:glycosyltransferase involved in cell wall biosynthesis